MTYRVPVEIETNRLKLLKPKESDWKDLYEYYSDSEAVKYTVNRKVDETEAWYIHCSMIGHWEVRGYGPYTIVDKESNNVLGLAGYWFPLNWPGQEIKWALIRKYWNLGYAREAVLKLREISHDCFPNTQLISVIRSENALSIKLAEFVGASLKEEVIFNGLHWKIFNH